MRTSQRKRGRPKTAARPPAEPGIISDVVEVVPLSHLRPATVNDEVYGPTTMTDARVVRLARSIKKRGLQEPLLVSRDNVIVAGHGRRMACLKLGITKVPVRRHWIASGHPEFAAYVVDCNEYRDKTPAQRLNEEVVRTSSDAAFEALSARRAERLEQLLTGADDAGLASIRAGAARRRATISEGKQEMLEAARRVLDNNRRYWPLTLRQVHYRLLNDPPPRNTNPRHPTGPYQNDRASYQDLSDLLTRARIARLVPWEAIADETRPVSIWRKWPNVGGYVREQLDGLFGTYRRDVLQSQPAHIEIVAEKMTVQATADRVASALCANVMVGRGFSSITARYELVRRFEASGKESLMLLVLSDFDPEGECIAETLLRSIRDEFDVTAPVRARKVALTADQVRDYRLPPGGQAKTGSSRYEAFVRRHGVNVYELEALEPAQLEALIRDALAAVIDHDLLRHEQTREAEEARELEARRRIALNALGGQD